MSPPAAAAAADHRCQLPYLPARSNLPVSECACGQQPQRLRDKEAEPDRQVHTMYTRWRQRIKKYCLLVFSHATDLGPDQIVLDEPIIIIIVLIKLGCLTFHTRIIIPILDRALVPSCLILGR